MFPLSHSRSGLTKAITSVRHFASSAEQSNVLFLYNLPNRFRDDNKFTFHERLREGLKAVYEISSAHAPVKQVRFSTKTRNFGWVEFMKVADAVSFKGNFSKENPLVILGNDVSVEFASLRSTAPEFYEDSSELVLRYSPSTKPSNGIMEQVKQHFSGANISTNVKTTTGSLGTFFIRYDSVDKARKAFESYQSNPLTLGESIGELACHPRPGLGLHLYNLKPFCSRKEILKPLQSFGDIMNLSLEFDRTGPRVSGRAYIRYTDRASASKLFAATLNEEAVINGYPLRAENLWSAKQRTSAKPSKIGLKEST